MKKILLSILCLISLTSIVKADWKAQLKQCASGVKEGARVTAGLTVILIAWLLSEDENKDLGLGLILE